MPAKFLAFSILIADVENYFKRKGNGGVKLEKRRVFSLVSADYMAILWCLD